MAYATYTTAAIVCGTYDHNTADRSYQLFTEELGMVYATARSVRLEKSRQRYALTDFSVVRVSLVRGKSGWRVGSIVPGDNLYHEAVDQAARGSVRNVVRTVRRFVTGEEPHAALYVYVHDALLLLATPLAAALRPTVEAAVLVRILAFLGYVSVDILPPEVATQSVAKLPTALRPEDEATLLKLIATAERASQL